MATPVQSPVLETIVDHKTMHQHQWVFSRNRLLGPVVIAAFLIAFYFVSPFLPESFRQFLAAVR